MNCDQETNKSVIGEHCFDCLCTGELAGVGHGIVPARKARRSTNVVKERGRPDTLSCNKWNKVLGRESIFIKMQI